MLSFAKKLKVPYTGDVEFIFKNGGGKQEDGTPLKLYAFRDILEPTFDFSGTLLQRMHFSVVFGFEGGVTERD